MGGPFMVEIVFCRVTRRGRKKKAGLNKAGRDNMRNDGPSQSFIPPDTLKVTLDLSDTGPVFGALDDMMLKMSMDFIEEDKGKKKDSGEAKNALKKLLRSGIPGIEGMFGQEEPAPRFGKKGGKKGFHKMNENSRKKFMNAIFGEEGTQIDSSTAAALLATTCSGGDPNIGNRLAELLIPEMDEKVDPAMMAALMTACSLISAGAGTEEVMAAMKGELAASGLPEEEILHKTQLLMKAFGKEEAGSTAEYKMLSKQKNKALIRAELNPKDFTAIVLAHKAIAACGSSPENCAKMLMIYSTLAKKGAHMDHIAASMKNLGSIEEEKKAECIQKIITSWSVTKFNKMDVMVPVRMHQALDNENEPGWAEVKNLKEIVGGVSPNSPEAIELNLARATKSGGLKKDDIGRALIAFKAISALGIDEVQMARIMFLEKTICENGVPGSEVGRVLSDGMMPAEATASMITDAQAKLTEEFKPHDVECAVKVYNNLKFKSNIPTEVVEFVDKSLIQVRCSLEDVADNMISSQMARGEKTGRIISHVTETLKKTGATANVIAMTMMPPLMELTGETEELKLVQTICRNLKDVDFEVEEVKSAMLEMVLKILDNDPSQHAEACSVIENTLKEFGEFPPEIKDFIVANLPPPPTPPEEIERRKAVAAELERLQMEEEERERLKKLKDTDPEAYYRETGQENPDAKGPLRELQRSDSLLLPEGQVIRSRQGSIHIGGTERRGSYYSEEVTTRASVAVVTDDPEHKKKLKEGLAGAFADNNSSEAKLNGTPSLGHPGKMANLPPGAKVQTAADGSIQVVGADGKVIPGGAGQLSGALPPGAMVVNAPDGSVQVVGADGKVIPNGAALLGGATALPPGAKINTAPDGSVQVVGADGKVIPGGAALLGGAPTLPPGATVKTAPDGSVEVVSADGKVIPGGAALLGGGSTLPPGATVKNAPDGSVQVVGADGKVIPGGTSLIGGAPALPPGSTVNTAPDGSVHVVGADGKVIPGGAALLGGTAAIPSGATVKTLPNGSIQVVKMVDGKVVPGGANLLGGGAALPPGATVKPAADGSVQVVGADGKVIPGGASILEGGSALPPGATVKTAADGSVQVVGADGKVIPGGAALLGKSGGLPPGAKIQTAADGSVTVVGADGKVIPGGAALLNGPAGLPPGAKVQKGPGGVMQVVGADGKVLPNSAALLAGGAGGKLSNLANGPISGMSDLLGGLPDGASYEEIERALRAAGISESDMKSMMTALRSQGRDGLSPESRALMEQILASDSSKDEISSRVAALLAGTALSTTRGAARKNTVVDMAEYDAANLSEARERKDTFEMPTIPRLEIPGEDGEGARAASYLAAKKEMLREGMGAGPMSRDSAGGVRMRDHGGTVKRGSIKRQSEILREKKISRQEEREQDKQRNASYFRKVTGLRRAKVPLMVYSCGGFSRCFRVARFYDAEGPPVGVEYERSWGASGDERKQLNPEL